MLTVVCVKRLGMARLSLASNSRLEVALQIYSQFKKGCPLQTLRPISTHEKFPRTENFPKISLLKVEIFQVENLLKICISQSNFTKFSFRGKFS
jgi:hypothetical protein